MTIEKRPAPVKRSIFLKDILICSLGAFGGPESHFGVFTDQLIEKKGYITEEEMIELIALNSMLPGPTSTQTIVSVGYKIGGPVLALLTLMVWALPVLIIMTILSFLYQFLDILDVSYEALRYIGPMAVGFILVAAFKIGRKVIVDCLSACLLTGAALLTYFIRSSWIFPVSLLLGGTVSILFSREKELWNKVKLNPPWVYFAAFSIFALGSIALKSISNWQLAAIFESFYRFGYLIFGGGQVVVPVMYTELVQTRELMSSGEFLTGYGLVQGLPGPMFSFSAYAGGMAARGNSAFYQILGSLAAGIGIFLPGVLLIFFIYPIWENLKTVKGIKVSLKGINAVAGGLISISAVILLQKSGISWDNIMVTAMTTVILWSKKIPTPLLVIFVIILGVLV